MPEVRTSDYLGFNFTVGFVGVSLSHQTLKLCQCIVALQVMYKKTCSVTLKQSLLTTISVSDVH